jgi:hypothetical protein
MKTFDWELYDVQGHRPAWIKWMKENYNRPVTEEEFVRAYQSLRIEDTRPHNAKRYRLSKVTGQYRSFRDNYGFLI